MKKIPSLFVRNYTLNRKLCNVITEGCEWVIKGEGTPTREFDGTACMIKDDFLYKRYDCKKGRKVPITGIACQPEPDPVTGHWPWWISIGENDKLYKRYDCKKGRRIVITVDNIPCQEAPDPVTGHWPWWIPIDKNDKYHMEAFERMPIIKLDGTYELCGPKVNGNPEGFEYHTLVRHGCEMFTFCPTDFKRLPLWMINARVEGIVWHHRDGRMCKIKLKDFGIKREKR